MSGAHALPEPPLPRTRAAPIFAVASGKGGVGKTWLSTMLSIAFGRGGHRALLDVFGGLDLAPVTRAWAEVTRIEAELLKARELVAAAERDRVSTSASPSTRST